MMLSRRRGEAWAAHESDYSQSVPKGHRQPWARLRKVVETGLTGSHAGDRAPATKQISLRRNTFALATTNSRNRHRVVLSSNEAPLRRENSGAASLPHHPKKGTFNGFHRFDHARLQNADRDRLCAGRAGYVRSSLFAGAGADVHRRRDAALLFGNPGRRSRHRLHGPEARAAQRRLQSCLPLCAARCRDVRELHPSGKTLQAAQPDPAQARLSIFLIFIKPQRHVLTSRTWRLAFRPPVMTSAAFIPHSG